MDLLPEATSVFWKSNRLKTFTHWPFQSADDKCNPEKMAAAGFIATGDKEEPDAAECFMCGKTLDGWDPDDDPWDEHIKHQASCPFVKLNKQNETSWSISELLNLLKLYLVKEYTREVEKAKAKIREESEKLVTEIPNIYKALQNSKTNRQS